MCPLLIHSSGLSIKSNHSPTFSWFLRNSHTKNLQLGAPVRGVHFCCTPIAPFSQKFNRIVPPLGVLIATLFDERRRVQPKTLVQSQPGAERRDVAIPLSFIEWLSGL
jgi:hypothetical protein